MPGGIENKRTVIGQFLGKVGLGGRRKKRKTKRKRRRKRKTKNAENAEKKELEEDANYNIIKN